MYHTTFTDCFENGCTYVEFSNPRIEQFSKFVYLTLQPPLLIYLLQCSDLTTTFEFHCGERGGLVLDALALRVGSATLGGSRSLDLSECGNCQGCLL